ncbi:MAG: putative selenium-dependent hydroxylase accessory protein YqeC [Anaerolineae bacterium]|nr:putative selenium-dependent hydroxylase accessory protein YqeC [Anaerolineae bacterium]
MLIREALHVQRGDVVAFTGAGGKTSTLFRLGRELAELGWRVLGTTTTRLAVEEVALAPGALGAMGARIRPEAISRALGQHGFVFLYHNFNGDKAVGFAPDTIDALLDSVDSDVILVEADGARRLPFKAPREHEPVLPAATTLAVPVVGVDIIGQPLDAEHVYNPQAMIARYGYPEGERVKWPWVASVLRDTELGLKGIPDHARAVALINKVPEDGLRRTLARLVARLALREARMEAVALGAVQSLDDPILEIHRRVAAVVLAGGLSRRMEQPGHSKVLLPWDGRPIIRVIVDRLKRLRLDDLVVVTGHVAAKVRAALGDEPVRFAHNKEYRQGDMLSSLQAGLRALGPHIAACLVVLGDQPQLDNRVVAELINAYAEGRGRIVAPSYQNRRGHPILIDRAFWKEILDLPVGGSPRDVINAHADDISYVPVETDSILRDIDTPDDYRDERRRAGLT